MSTHDQDANAETVAGPTETEPEPARRLSIDELAQLRTQNANAREVSAPWWLRLDGSTVDSTATVVWARLGYPQHRCWDEAADTWVDQEWINYGHHLQCLTCPGRDDCLHTVAATAVRALEIQREAAALFPEPDTLLLDPDVIVGLAADTATWLHDRVSEGEFVGQRHDTLLYLSEVSRILGWRGPDFAGDVIAELRARKALGLNGNILIPYAEEEATYAHFLTSTGHRRLTTSDFGWWRCAACGRHGDDWTDPASQPCSPATATEAAPEAVPAPEHPTHTHQTSDPTDPQEDQQ